MNSTSIQMSNLHNNDLVSCKFCLDDIFLNNKTSYLIPCKCRGTIQFIHPRCLSQFFVFYKTTKCSLCMSTFTFIRWYHYFFSTIISIALFSLLFTFFFNLQIICLYTINSSNYTYEELFIFKKSKYYFIILDFWITSLILIMFNLILNNGTNTPLYLSNPKMLFYLPFFSLKITFNTVFFLFLHYFLIYYR